MRRAAVLALGLALVAGGPAPAGGGLRAADLKLIGVLQPAKDLSLDGAPFGGVSGIDYDRSTGAWLMVSDDRSEKAPARFYAVRLDYGADGVHGLRLERATPLRREDGSTFAATPGGQDERADAEALRLDPLNGQIVWSSEGDPDRGFDPAVRRTDRRGAFLSRIPSPRGFGFRIGGRSGARPNKTIESLSFSIDGRFLWMAMEAPLIQDGPVSTASAGGLARIAKLDRDGRVLAQYAYRLDPVQAASAGRSDNGISEILAVDDDQLLVLERSGVEAATGRFAYHCRLYVVDVRGARDVKGRASLDPGAVKPLAKRLLVNFDRLAGAPTANLEAMAWGPRLADGARTLVLAADDNFRADEPGLFVVLRVR